METTAQVIIFARIFIWGGVIIGISFIESWVKFKSSGATQAIDLGIGRIVFSASNILQLRITIVTISVAFWIKITLSCEIVFAIILLLITTLHKAARIPIKT